MIPENLNKRVYNTFETAKILGMGHNQIRALVHSGALTALPGRNIKISEFAIRTYLRGAKRGSQ